MLVGVRECRSLAVLSASLQSADTQQGPVSLRKYSLFLMFVHNEYKVTYLTLCVCENQVKTRNFCHN